MATPFKDLVDLVVYHDRCPDGITSAYIASIYYKKQKREVQYMGLRHPFKMNEEILSSFLGSRLLVFDFSFPKADIELFVSKDVKLEIHDHHESARENISSFDFCYFDLNKSGATLAWSYFFPDQPVPEWILFVEDRDLWRHALPNAVYFNTALEEVLTYEPQADFAVFETFEDNQVLEKMVEEGQVIRRFVDKDLNEQAQKARNATFVCPDGSKYQVAAINIQTRFASELGNLMARMYQDSVDCAFLWYYDHGTKMTRVSLRSLPKFNCIPVCRQFGGGGHPCAAGFNIKESVLDYLKDE